MATTEFSKPVDDEIASLNEHLEYCKMFSTDATNATNIQLPDVSSTLFFMAQSGSNSAIYAYYPNNLVKISEASHPSIDFTLSGTQLVRTSTNGVRLVGIYR